MNKIKITDSIKNFLSPPPKPQPKIQLGHAGRNEPGRTRLEDSGDEKGFKQIGDTKFKYGGKRKANKKSKRKSNKKRKTNKKK